MREDTALAGDHFHDFFLSEFTAEAHVHQVASGQAASALGRERAFAVKAVVGIYSATELVGCYRDAATQVGDNQVHVLVALALLLGKAACDGTLVQRVPDADAREAGITADAGDVVQLVGHCRVGDIAGALAIGNLTCNDATQVGSVLML